MTSPLARQDIELIWEQGGRVSVDDIVRLNALALKITDRPDSDLSVLPRFTSVQGVHFREPTVGQSIFLDEAKRVFPEDEGTLLALIAYVLAHEDVDVKELKHPFVFKTKVLYWVMTALKKMTLEQLEQIVCYCLYGCDDTDGEYPFYKVDEMAERDLDRLGSDSSWALRHYLEAVAVGIDSVTALRQTSSQLCAMIERAYVVHKLPLSDTQKRLTADYYRTLDHIRGYAFKKDDGEDGAITDTEDTVEEKTTNDGGTNNEDVTPKADEPKKETEDNNSKGHIAAQHEEELKDGR